MNNIGISVFIVRKHISSILDELRQNASYVLRPAGWDKKSEVVKQKLTSLSNASLSLVQNENPAIAKLFSQITQFGEDFKEGKGMFLKTPLIHKVVELEFMKSVEQGGFQVYTPLERARTKAQEIFQTADQILYPKIVPDKSGNPSVFEKGEKNTKSVLSSSPTSDSTSSPRIKRSKISSQTNYTGSVARVLTVLQDLKSQREICDNDPKVVEITSEEFIKTLVKELSLPANLGCLKKILKHEMYSDNDIYNSSQIAYEIFETICKKPDWNFLAQVIDPLLEFANPEGVSLCMQNANLILGMPSELKTKIDEFLASNPISP